MSDHTETHRNAALRHEDAAKNHDRSATFWDGQGKHEHAGLQRKLAAYERAGAELERQWAQLTDPDRADHAPSTAERARALTREHAERLSVMLGRTAETLEKTAASLKNTRECEMKPGEATMLPRNDRRAIVPASAPSVPVRTPRNGANS